VLEEEVLLDELELLREVEELLVLWEILLALVEVLEEELLWEVEELLREVEEDELDIDVLEELLVIVVLEEEVPNHEKAILDIYRAFIWAYRASIMTCGTA
jgi:uncharacterized protein (UPF0335 family)